MTPFLPAAARSRYADRGVLRLPLPRRPLRPEDVVGPVAPEDGVPRLCRGWGLVARRDRLTPDEQSAADGHLLLCRRCRERRARLETVRTQVAVGAGLGGLALAAEAWLHETGAGAAASALGPPAASLGAAGSAGSSSGSFLGLLAGKAGIVLVGGLASGLLATGSAAVAAHHAAPPTGRAGSDSLPGLDRPAPLPTSPVLPARVQGGTGVDLPTSPPASLLTSPPTSVQTSLPTSLPASVPTSLPTSLPLPGALPSLPSLPSLPVSVPLPGLPHVPRLPRPATAPPRTGVRLPLP